MTLKLKKQEKLDAMAMVFTMKYRGAVTAEKTGRFAEKTKRKIGGVNQRDIDSALKTAQECYLNGRIHLFICNGSSCKKKAGKKTVKKRIKDLKARLDLKVSKTKCQGACSRAPITTIRVGKRCKVFLNVSKKKNWRALEDFTG